MLEDKEKVAEQKRRNIRYIQRYQQENTKTYTFRFHINYDQDIINCLESKPNKRGYIKNLIRNDLAKTEEEQK